MKKSRSVTAICCLGLILFSSLAPVSAGAATVKDPLMDMLPDSTLFCVRINNYTNSMGLLDQYLAGASPMPLSMTVNMMLGGALGDPMMNGVNKYGTFAVIGMTSSGQEEPVVAFLIPITDAKQFTSKPFCQGPDENGVYTLDAPNSPMGSLSFIPVENQTYLLVGPGEQKAGLQTAQTLFKEKKTSLAARINSADVQQATTAPAWAWLNLEAGYAMLGPVMRMGFEEAMEAQQQVSMGMQPQAMKGMMDGFDKWMQQADSLTLALTPQPTLLTAEVNFIPKADSELAKMLVRGPGMKTGFKMGGYLDPEAPISGLMNMNKPLWEKANRIVIDLFMMGMGSTNDSKELMTQFNTMMEKSMKAMGPEIAFSFAYHAGMPPFSLREAIEIQDPKGIRNMLHDSSAFVNQMYEQMGISAKFEFQEGQETYQGTAIDKAKIKFDLPEDAPEQQKVAMEAMYGKEGIVYPFAITDDTLYVTMGPKADAELKKLIDMKKNLPAMPSDMQIAMQSIPQAETADIVMSVNIIRLMKGFSEMMTTMAQGAPAGTPVPPFAQMLEGIQLNTQSAMAIGTHIDKGRAQIHYALPKQHLMEITAVGMQIQQKIMMQQMQQQMQQQQQSQPEQP